MLSPLDPLFALFEQHLFNALVEDETTEDFLNRVVAGYLARLAETCVIPQQLRGTIEQDLREEVLEMLRKRTYGHYSLSEFRRAMPAVLAPEGPAPLKATEGKKADSSGRRRNRPS